MANTISITQTVQSRAETSVVISWQTDAMADYLWYSINNGDTWTGVAIAEGTAGSYGIVGLSAVSPYQIKTRARRKGTQITAESSALQVVTYAYPSAISTPDFVIGKSVTIGLFNPLSRSVTVALYDITNTIRAAGSTSGTSITFTPAADPLYQSIPNSKRAAYSIRVLYDGQSQNTVGGDYEADYYNAAPEIGSVSYQDINPDTYTITGNDAQIIQGKSVVRYSVTGIAARKYASIVSCYVSIGNQVYEQLTISGSTASGGDSTIDFPDDVQAQILVTDSRGFITAKSFPVTMLEWHKPSAVVTLRRHSNFYSETDITASADYSPLDSKNVVSITYEARKSGTSSYTISGTLTDEVTTTFTADNAFAWDVKVTVSDLLGESSEYNLNLPKGTPIFFVDRLKSSVGINCFPADENSLEIGGVNVTPSAVTLSLKSNLVVSAVDTYVKLPLDSHAVFGKRLSPVSGGGVMVGPNLSAVLVSGQINIKTAGGAGVRGIALVNGLMSVLEIVQAFDDASEAALIVPPTLVPVQEGKILYLAFSTSSGADLIYGHNSLVKTSLTVTTI